MEVKTQKEQYDELIADLKDGSHEFNGRPVMTWAEYDVAPETLRFDPGPKDEHIPHPWAGTHVVSVQYAGPADGDGALLRDYTFNPEDLKAPEAEVTVTDKAAVKETAEK
jgi:hypothetical protein